MAQPLPNAHPDDFQGSIPRLIPSKDAKRLAQINTARAIGGLCLDWALIIAAIVVCERFRHPALYVLTIIFIGARQHALSVLGHDGVHYRLFNNRRCNDWFSNLLVFWPLLLTCEGFRYVHSAHHRYLGTERDIQAIAFGMTTEEGFLNETWKYPKSTPRLLRNIVMVWQRDVWASLASLSKLHYFGWKYCCAFAAFLTASAVLLATAGWLREALMYWLVARLTWFPIANHIRLICQHSGLRGPEGAYGETRTTIPTFLERIFVLPRNITYHIEHHWYPAVPCYNLPRLHVLLMQHEEFQRKALISRGLYGVWREVTDPSPVTLD